MEVLKKNILLIAIILQTVVMGSVIGIGWGEIGVLEHKNDALQAEVYELEVTQGKVIDYFKEFVGIVGEISDHVDQNKENINILDRQVRRIKSNGNN